jgi:hypothetical protein
MPNPTRECNVCVNNTSSSSESEPASCHHGADAQRRARLDELAEARRQLDEEQALLHQELSMDASDLCWASWAWLRAAASYSRDARDCSSSAWTSERQARTRSHGGPEKKRKTGPRFNTHSGAASTNA